MPLKNILSFYFIIFASLLRGQVAVAQKIVLKDVDKIQLITAGSWMDGYYKKVELVSENGVWKSYQTRLFSRFFFKGRPKANDSTRMFVKDVPTKLVEEFVGIATKPDSVIRQDLFDIKPNELITQLDSMIDYDLITNRLKSCPPPEWRNKFIKAVNSKAIIGDALYDVLHPMLMDDRSHYTIIVTDNRSVKDTIEADAYIEPYYLPWRMKNGMSFNPNITKLFLFMSGDKTSEKNERRNLNYQLVSELYYNHSFKSMLDWDRFKTEQPDIYGQASKTLIPLKFSRYNERTFKPEYGYNGYFLSKRLPSYMQLSLNFSKDPPEFLTYSNKIENKVAAWYKGGNFLFDFVKHHPHSKMLVNISIRNELYEEIVKRYPEISKFERKQIMGFSVVENGYLNNSAWLLLPDDKVMLTGYNGTLSNNYQTKFGVIPPDRYIRGYKYVCIVFDKHGKVIGGSEEPFEVKKPEL